MMKAGVISRLVSLLGNASGSVRSKAVEAVTAIAAFGKQIRFRDVQWLT